VESVCVGPEINSEESINRMAGFQHDSVGKELFVVLADNPWSMLGLAPLVACSLIVDAFTVCAIIRAKVIKNS
jgi:hypothetical protein